MPKRKRKKRKNISQDSSVTSGASGAGGSGDQTRSFRPGIQDFLGSCGKYMPFNVHYGQEYFFYIMWRKFWEAKKIVNIPAYDMTKEGWQYINPDIDPEKINDLKKEEARLDLQNEINRALQYERLYGGSVIVIGTQEEKAEASQPLKPEYIQKDGLKFMRALSRVVLSVSAYDTDPLSPNYDKPLYYDIRGTKIHRSRLLVFSGGGQHDREVLQGSNMLLSPERFDGFGYSILEPLFDDIIKAAGSRQAAFQLINKASVMIFKRLGESTLGDYTVGAEYNKQAIKDVMDSLSIYRAAILDKGSDLSNYSSTFGSTPELLISYLQVLSAASDIPAARFLGESPGGLNATGKGELKNYYDSLHAQQEIRLRPQLMKLLPYLQKSALGEIYDGFEIKFPTLDQATKFEQADIDSKNWLTISDALTQGVGDDEWAAKEALEKGIFLNDPREGQPDITQKEEEDAIEEGV